MPKAPLPSSFEPLPSYARFQDLSARSTHCRVRDTAVCEGAGMSAPAKITLNDMLLTVGRFLDRGRMLDGGIASMHIGYFTEEDRPALEALHRLLAKIKLHEEAVGRVLSVKREARR